MLDDATFHECVEQEEWEKDKVLRFHPPDGECVVLNYRISEDFRLPFRINPFVEEMGADRVDLIIKVSDSNQRTRTVKNAFLIF